MESPGEITALLAEAGDGAIGDRRLAERLYPMLRRLAAARLSGGDEGVSLQPSDLVHETFLRLAAQSNQSFANRAHFFAVAARVMRRVLVDYLRERRASKRGGDRTRIDLEDLALRAPEAHPDLLDLDRALSELEESEPEAARLVELRYFGGLSVEEAAEALGVGRSTVVRRWRFARAWLSDALGGVQP